MGRDDEGLYIRVDGIKSVVARISRAFPRTDPGHFISFLDEMGHEMGIVEDPSGLDGESKELLETELKEIYFVPTISEVQSITTSGISHHFKVLTDDGEYEFEVANLDALDGSHPPEILIRSQTGKRYRIEDYWELSSESRELTANLVPRKVLQARYGRGSSSGGSGRGRGGRSSGGMMRFR